jgi:pimeloyl-ACP methyl ester carboxylesterase
VTAATAAFRHRQLDLAGSNIHVVEAGDPLASPVLFLHGWPQDWSAWRAVMTRAARQVRAVAIDLPGIGGSTGDATNGSKRQLAEVVRRLIAALELDHPTIVGHDAGGMVAYAYLWSFGDLGRAVIMDTVIPGVDPWDDVLRNPYVWHFAMHSIPSLPERLVSGREREYFDYFYDVLSPDPSTITQAARVGYVQAYARDTALTAGFNWYRTLTQDALDNREACRHGTVDTPVLYLRGEKETGRVEDYLRGFAAAGLRSVDHALVPGAGHFAQEDAAEEVWRLIAEFTGL